jgi:molybdopterin molybdotransferase
MKTVQEAEEIVLTHCRKWGVEHVPFSKAVGRVLREPLCADRDFPPFDRVAMDGIAMRFEAWRQGVHKFRIEGIQPAGAVPCRLQSTDGCIEIMTGAVLPEGADTVIPYEQIELAGGYARVRDVEVRQGQNVHRQGLDRKKGEIIVEAGRSMTAAEIGIAATVGKVYLGVSSLPRTAVIATGDELVYVGEEPLPHQIRMSNIHQIAALLTGLCVQPELVHLADNREALAMKLERCLADNEVCILSGGVSRGKFDFVPDVMAQCGVTWLCDKVKQRPGKPFWFGTAPGGKTIFALPGNPVSTFACMHRYVLPWYRKTLGLDPLPQEFARLASPFSTNSLLTFFLQVALQNAEGELLAVPVQGKGSGDLANLADADAFIELPGNRTEYGRGELFRVFRFRHHGGRHSEE